MSNRAVFPIAYAVLVIVLQRPASGQSTADVVEVEKQLYSYWDAKAATKYLGYTSDVAYQGQTFRSVAVGSDLVSFQSCEGTALTVPSVQLKKVTGKCTVPPADWARFTQGVAVQGRFVALSPDGKSTTFAIKTKDGAETFIDLPKDWTAGLQTKQSAGDDTVLFVQDPKLWSGDVTAASKALAELNKNNAMATIKARQISVFAVPK